MQTIRLTTLIAAPITRVFLLSLNVDLHTASTKHTDEHAIAGVTHGVMGPGDTVTWKARHFGLMLTHTSVITKYSHPNYFEDTMTKGAFKSFVHLHSYTQTGDTTLMSDELAFASPMGILGKVVDWLLLRKYLTSFLAGRNLLIKKVAESDQWAEFIGTDSTSLM